MSVYFNNPGLIPVEAIRTLGVSVKDGDGAIGYFGTGLKFAISTILRGGGKITIWRGLERFDFGVSSSVIRGRNFDIVTMNGVELGFTTEMGKNWLPWMAFRELASNARDEGGAYGSTEMKPAEGETLIVVDCPDIAAAYSERAELFIEGAPLATIDDVEIYPGEGKSIFYRGVRVADNLKPMAFRYNVTSNITLTEDRTAKNVFELLIKVARAFSKCENRALIEKVLHRPEGTFEYEIDFNWTVPHEAFREAIAVINPLTHQGNRSAKTMAHGSAIERALSADPAPLDAVPQSMLNRAKRIATEAGLSVDSYPIKVVDDLGPNVHGLAKDGTIFLSRLPFRKGTREVAATLVEEFAHLESGAGDCTREFQNWIFDALLVQVEKNAREAF